MLLYYITDRHAFPGDGNQQRRALLARVADAAAAGVDYIQLREKDLSTRELELLAKETIAAVRANSSATRLLINGRTDVALACGADGVHLPSDCLPVHEVRALWMAAWDRVPVIGVSVHSAEEVCCGQAQGADFIALAPIFEKPKTAIPGLGLSSLSLACRRARPPDNPESAPKTSLPVLALGGVSLENAAHCLRAGAAGVAGIRLFQEGNLRETVGILRQLDGQP